MHRPQSVTWTTHRRVDNSPRLQEALHLCNIATEFYLYSIVYIYLINSRLDVTFSVRHQFRTIRTLSWCQISGKNSRNRRENLSDRTRTQQQQQRR